MDIYVFRLCAFEIIYLISRHSECWKNVSFSIKIGMPYGNEMEWMNEWMKKTASSFQMILMFIQIIGNHDIYLIRVI